MKAKKNAYRFGNKWITRELIEVTMPRMREPSDQKAICDESALGSLWLKIAGARDLMLYESRIRPGAPILSLVEKWCPRLLTDELSAREMQVFKLIAQGWGTHAIGRTYHLSPSTVATYRSRILDFTGFESDAQIAVYAYRHELITWPFAQPGGGRRK